MKKLCKERMEKIMDGGPICNGCADEYVQCFIEGKCYCVPQGMCQFQ
ncbi:GNAT family acetyltransferase [Chryseobacterium tongliaoense]